MDTAEIEDCLDHFPLLCRTSLPSGAAAHTESQYVPEVGHNRKVFDFAESKQNDGDVRWQGENASKRNGVWMSLRWALVDS